MSEPQCTEQLELFEVGRQQVTMTFDGGQIVSDAGLLPIRELDKKLGILAEAARRLPDPRTENAVTHTTEDILTQQVYQILAGYLDGNELNDLHFDSLVELQAYIGWEFNRKVDVENPTFTSSGWDARRLVVRV